METDTTKKFYEEHADEFEEKTKDRQKINWIEKFLALLPSKANILDLGCAYGRDSETFAKKGFQVTGIDFSEAFIQKAKEHVPEATFLVDDIRTMQLQNQSFDGIWASAVLLHISKSDVEKVLGTLHESLRDNGVLFLGMYLGEGEGNIPDSRYENTEKYYSFFSEDELKNLLRETGFSILTAISRKKDTYERNDVIELIAKKS